MLEKHNRPIVIYEETRENYRFDKNYNAYKEADEYDTYYLDDPDAYTDKYRNIGR